MIEIIMEIGLYIILAIVLGFLFGWFIAKASGKESYENKEAYAEEEKILLLKRVHEKEVEAFLSERTDIIQKYKELLLKIEDLKKSQLL